MKKFFLITVLFFQLFLQVKAGGTNENLQKYWIYRERVKNFIFSSNGIGSGMVITSRDAGSAKFAGTADEPWFIGYWIATLAMEWRLLYTHNQSTAQTEKELYYALYALRRLDNTDYCFKLLKQ